MITIEQARAILPAAPHPVEKAAPPASAPAPAARILLHTALLLTILLSPMVFVEPSPYEASSLLLGFACLLARIPLDRRIMPMVFLLIIWNIGGGIALLQVSSDEAALRYAVISIFMALTAVIYGVLFTQDTMRRLTIMRNAYVAAAMFAAVIGTIGYFNLFPGAGDLFATMGRANATFKDPNVFGPFLILPLLFLIQSVLGGTARLHHLILLLVIGMGLLLSFSRGAWAHFVVSAAVMVVLMLLTAPDLRTRARLILLSAIALAAMIILLVGALSIEEIGDMFRERAKLIQDYDAGSSMSRFNLQQIAIGAILEHPLGMGPFAFGWTYGQQHNVYMQAFLVYGWLGGAAYLALVLMTLAVGLRAILVATPWQLPLIAIYATFVGELFEGFVIDTDHWRHFFLLLGLIWALSAATANETRVARLGAAQYSPRRRSVAQPG